MMNPQILNYDKTNFSESLERIESNSFNNSDGGNSNGQTVVYLENISYSFGDENVLNGFTMAVNGGTIYGLLGASGCGM